MGRQTRPSVATIPWRASLQTDNHGLRLTRSGKAGQFHIPIDGFMLHEPSGLVAVPGDSFWTEQHGIDALEIIAAQIPFARAVAAPVLAHEAEHLGDPGLIRPDLLLPIRLPGRFYKVDAVTVPEAGLIAVSSSTPTMPAFLALHEAWHLAEHTLLTTEEIEAVGLAYGLARQIQLPQGVPNIPDPREWAAHAYARWYELWGITAGSAMTCKELDAIFHRLASGEMGRRLQHPANMEILDLYLDAADDVWAPQPRP